MERVLTYKGKTKNLYVDEEGNVIVEFRDDATAGKGSLNAEVSARLFEYLREKDVRAHYLDFIKPNVHVVEKVEMIPFKEGLALDPPVIEMAYKSPEYHDPILNDDIAIALGAATREELDEMRALTREINGYLNEFLEPMGIILVDFKLEFGRDAHGHIVLADEISPDTCRFWDAETKTIMDKDSSGRTWATCSSTTARSRGGCATDCHPCRFVPSCLYVEQPGSDQAYRRGNEEARLEAVGRDYFSAENGCYGEAAIE